MQELSGRTAKLTQLERVLSEAFCLEHPHMATLYVMLASFNATNVRTLQGHQEPVSPQDLAATQVPVLYLVGESDILFPPEAVRTVHEHTAGSAFVVMPRAGHSAYFEQPQQFNEHIEAWLSTISVDV
jgi:pimeloyl-ACP methyl ester carboxylesterase